MAPGTNKLEMSMQKQTYRLIKGPMMIDGVIRETGDTVEVDDDRAKAWGERLELVGGPEPKKKKKPEPKPEPEPEPEPEQDEPEDEPGRAVEGDEMAEKPVRRRRGKSG
jgi:hypothetical protein